MSKALKIYIAGPYTAETEEQRLINVQAAIDISFILFNRGHFPYVPHLTHYIDLRANAIGHQLTWEDYMKWDTPWLKACDALFYLSSSRGVDIELQVAKELGKQIFYSLDDVPNVILKHYISNLVQE